MRIISGKLGGRLIKPPTNMPKTRPTTDRAKEGLFNILQNNIDFNELKTLDLFGGTGAISYELFSRGATDLTVIEKDSDMFTFIQKTIAALHINVLKCIKMDVFQFLTQCTTQYDFIFAGPPYALTTIDELPKIIIAKNLLKQNGCFVLEHTPRNDYSNYEKFVQQRNYGTTVFSFFINKDLNKSWYLSITSRKISDNFTPYINENICHMKNEILKNNLFFYLLDNVGVI